MDESSSSDSGSDNGERVHNIQSVLIKSQDSRRELDPNYAYKQKLGDLIFNAHFEGANLGFVEQIDEFDYDLMVRPDVANPRHRIWFNFSVSNQRPNQCVVFTFVNLSENLILFNEGLTPVVRSREHPNWWRLDEDQVFYYKSASHNQRRVLSIAFRFSSHQNEHQFALFYPYNFSTLQNFIGRWQVDLIRRFNDNENDRQSPEVSRSRGRKTIGRMAKAAEGGLDFRVDTLATSVLFKPIYVLNIGIPMSENIDTRRRPKVIIMKQSSGNFNSVSSYVCQGYLDFMLSEDMIAGAARRHFDSIVFPMLDPDSVCVGNSRTDIFGQQQPPIISTTTTATVNSKKLLEANPNVYSNLRLAYEKVSKIIESSSAGARIILIELRVNCNLIGSRIVGLHYENSLRMERHNHLARLMSKFADGFYLERCEFRSRPELVQSSTAINFSNHNNVDLYVLEVSPFAIYTRSLMGLSYEEYDQRKYLLLGKSLAYSLLQLFRMTTTTTQVETLLPEKTIKVLDGFHLDSDDIDDLMLDDNRLN